MASLALYWACWQSLHDVETYIHFLIWQICILTVLLANQKPGSSSKGTSRACLARLVMLAVIAWCCQICQFHNLANRCLDAWWTTSVCNFDWKNCLLEIGHSRNGSKSLIPRRLAYFVVWEHCSLNYSILQASVLALFPPILKVSRTYIYIYIRMLPRYTLLILRIHAGASSSFF